MVKIPKLQPSERSREYDSYSEDLKSQVVYKFLFKGMAHRKIEREVLNLDPAHHLGFQAMNILHFLGLKKEFQGIFKGESLKRGIELLENAGSEYEMVVNLLKKIDTSNNHFSLDDFTADKVITPLVKEVGSSQFTDGVRIDKSYHGIFNPEASEFYTKRGTARKVKILFNDKIFEADYRYEGQSDKNIHLESIRFQKNLMEEFERVFPDTEGRFSITIGKNINYFIFNILQVRTIDVFKEIEEAEYLEGKEKYRLHKQRERSPKLVSDAKKLFKETHGTLFCEACGINFEMKYGERGRDFIEAHHLRYISELEDEEPTRISDLVMLCPNCHRMIHREPRITFEEFKISLKE